MRDQSKIDIRFVSRRTFLTALLFLGGASLAPHLAWAAVTAPPASLSVTEDVAQTFSVAASSTVRRDTLTYSMETQASHGTVQRVSGRTFQYVPASNYNGTDSFTFKAVSAADGSYGIGTVSIVVSAVNDAPVAYPVTAVTSFDQFVTFKLFGTDADGSKISYAITESPRHGSLMERKGRVTYAPETGYTGADSFAYATVSGGESSEAVTVRISVSPEPLFDRAATPQFGVNFIPFFSNDALQPDVVFADLEAMGAETFRQNGNGDVYWSGTEMRDGIFNFTNSDQTLAATLQEPIPTLFRLQYASPTPPWESDPARFQKTVGTEARDYIDQTVGHFAEVVRYWEIGNEMNHWVAADGGVQPEGLSGLSYPTDGFSPEEQALFLREAAEEIRAVDPDAVIVLPGIYGLEGNAQDWLRRVVTAQGSDWFDVVNYHYYGDWARFPDARASFQACLDELGLRDKPVWMTETGSASDVETDVLTNYPNSDTSQSSDVFRRVLAAYGAGESLVMWHSYWDNQENRESNFFSFGLVDEGIGKASYAAAQLLTSELLPFTQVTALSEDADGMMIYRVVTRDGLTKHVAWGSGSFSVPGGTTQMVSVYTADGGYEWQSVAAGDVIELSDIPVILK